MLPAVTATRYVTPLREGGSLPGLMEADDLGTYVVKFHGAGRAALSQVSWRAARRSAARPRGHVEVDPACRTSPTRRCRTCCAPAGASTSASTSSRLARPDAPRRTRLAAGLCSTPRGNVDRSWRNPNMLFWHGAPYLIDHGATLTFHHNWAAPGGAAPRATRGRVPDRPSRPPTRPPRDARRKWRDGPAPPRPRRGPASGPAGRATRRRASPPRPGRPAGHGVPDADPAERATVQSRCCGAPPRGRQTPAPPSLDLGARVHLTRAASRWIRRLMSRPSRLHCRRPQTPAAPRATGRRRARRWPTVPLATVQPGPGTPAPTTDPALELERLLTVLVLAVD